MSEFRVKPVMFSEAGAGRLWRFGVRRRQRRWTPCCARLVAELCYSAPKPGAKVRRREFLLLLGATAVAPAVRAQQPTASLIGFMSGRSPDDSRHLVAAFHQGLREAGFVEGKNVTVEYRWALGQYHPLPAFAADLVKRPVTVIAAVGGDVSAVAAKQATS